MEVKANLNTIVLLLILVALFIGGVVLFFSVQELVQSMQNTGQSLQKQLEVITHPTPTIIPDPVTIFHEVRSLSRLETASYSVEKIITAESGQGPFGFLFGDRLIFVAHGQVIAGVDLEKMEDGDVVVGGDGTVTITLPPAEILVVKLDNQKSYIYDRDTGLVGMNPALETEARRAAEEEIEKAALEDGILDMAQRNAETYLLRFLLSLGFSKVDFVQAEPSPTPTPAP